MSIKIKAKDIPADVKALFYKAIDHYPPKDAPAVWLNVAIQNGLVSPPVYVIRDTDNGNLLHEIVSGEVFMTANPDKAEIQGAVYEHWKGQME